MLIYIITVDERKFEKRFKNRAQSRKEQRKQDRLDKKKKKVLIFIVFSKKDFKAYLFNFC